jgi:hypothetical protein
MIQDICIQICKDYEFAAIQSKEASRFVHTSEQTTLSEFLARSMHTFKGQQAAYVKATDKHKELVQKKMVEQHRNGTQQKNETKKPRKHDKSQNEQP